MSDTNADLRAILEKRYGDSPSDAGLPSAAGIQEKSQQGMAAYIAARKKKQQGPEPTPSPSPGAGKVAKPDQDQDSDIKAAGRSKALNRM